MLRQATVLEHQERLASIVDMQVGSGVAKRGSALRHIRYLRRIAYTRTRKPATTGDLASMGIAVTVVKRGE